MALTTSRLSSLVYYRLIGFENFARLDNKNRVGLSAPGFFNDKFSRIDGIFVESLPVETLFFAFFIVIFSYLCMAM